VWGLGVLFFGLGCVACWVGDPDAVLWDCHLYSIWNAV
jgi:hypothetical protein